MSEFNEQDNIIEEETPVLHLELEDGTEQDCAVIALFSVEELNDQEYIALVSVEDLESEDMGSVQYCLGICFCWSYFTFISL